MPFTKQYVKLRESLEVFDILNSDHLSGLVEVLHGLLNVFVHEVYLSEQEIILPQCLVVSTKYFSLHFESILGIFQCKLELLRIVRKI